MKKIKILFEGLSSNLGGIEIFMHYLYQQMDKDIFDISFLLEYGVETPFMNEYAQDGVKFLYVTNRKRNYFKYLKELKNIYRNNDFDCIYHNLMSYSLFEEIIYSVKYSDAKIIAHSHGSGYSRGMYKNRILHFVGKHIINQNDLERIACEEKAGKYLFGNFSYKIFNNGIDFNNFVYDINARQLKRQELGISEKTYVIGTVASFLKVKNHEFLIDVFEKIAKKNPDSLLLLIGAGPLEEKIKRIVAAKSLTNKVLFLGKRTDVNKLYSAMDLYMMTSTDEGFGLSLCEAQINGLKCYATTGFEPHSNISGNVNFIPLNYGANKWIEIISQSDNSRDDQILNKIAKEYDHNVSYKKICDYIVKITNN